MPILKPTRGMIVPKGKWMANPIARELASCWLMNANSGTKLLDSVSLQKSDDFSGDVNWTSAKYGSALQLNGDADYVDVPAGTFPKFSIVWSLRGDDIGVIRRSLYQYFGIYSRTDSGTNKRRMALGNGAEWSGEIITDVVFSAGVHYQLAITYDGSTITAFVDGIAQSDTESMAGSVVLSDLRVGYHTGQAHNGVIDYIYIWSRNLSVSEIKQLYQNPFCLFECKPIDLFAAATQGGGVVEIAGTSAGSSVVSAIGSVLRKIISVLASTSVVSGAMKLARKIVGSSASTSVISVSSKVSRKVVGTTTVQSVVSGSLTGGESQENKLFLSEVF